MTQDPFGDKGYGKTQDLLRWNEHRLILLARIFLGFRKFVSPPLAKNFPLDFFYSEFFVINMRRLWVEGGKCASKEISKKIRKIKLENQSIEKNLQLVEWGTAGKHIFTQGYPSKLKVYIMQVCHF